MSADYYDTILVQRGLAEAFQLVADDARKLRARVEGLERQIAEHRCQLPPSIQEALNSGDGSYKP